ncbi:uncharacterized protein B0I36DRAFT_362408 [Microdochium trichocladiopsis]|uniref:Carboxylesterase type B domain-containing protein n=1 Tax=Microdochium trichocladiopsis TaxID=1682393 RepID=A0A9P8Y8C9_9PEZI|nr:uncharacterized protein B0I36DRAFT_362408 [Microdochium trichocladiopsis]KAH7030570.1 hypothetical protein B0I36DRAFT_362408 [Microdochium trichocladiopsis]
MRLPAVFTVAIVGFSALADCHALASTWASTLNGTYVGRRNAYYSQDEFLGIPYAVPPVGDLRFRSPISLNITWCGAREAREYSLIVTAFMVPHAWPSSKPLY